jgi:hypothetical protein
LAGAWPISFTNLQRLNFSFGDCVAFEELKSKHPEVEVHPGVWEQQRS